jgi:hypothetical protein
MDLDVCAAGAIAFSALSIIWIIRSYAIFSWTYIPAPDELERHHQALVEHYGRFGMAKTDAGRVFENQLRWRLIKAASRNALTNNQRSELIFQVSVFLSIAVIFTLVAGLPLLSSALTAVLQY